MNYYLLDEKFLQEILNLISSSRSDKTIAEIVFLVDKIRKLKPYLHKKDENEQEENAKE